MYDIIFAHIPEMNSVIEYKRTSHKYNNGKSYNNLNRKKYNRRQHNERQKESFFKKEKAQQH